MEASGTEASGMEASTMEVSGMDTSVSMERRRLLEGGAVALLDHILPVRKDGGGGGGLKRNASGILRGFPRATGLRVPHWIRPCTGLIRNAGGIERVLRDGCASGGCFFRRRRLLLVPEPESSLWFPLVGSSPARFRFCSMAAFFSRSP